MKSLKCLRAFSYSSDQNLTFFRTGVVILTKTPDFFLSPTQLSGFLAHHTLADFLSGDSRVFIADKAVWFLGSSHTSRFLSGDSRFFIADKTVWFLGSSHTSRFFVADLFSSYVTRVQILRGNCETLSAK